MSELSPRPTGIENISPELITQLGEQLQQKQPYAWEGNSDQVGEKRYFEELGPLHEPLAPFLKPENKNRLSRSTVLLLHAGLMPSQPEFSEARNTINQAIREKRPDVVAFAILRTFPTVGMRYTLDALEAHVSTSDTIQDIPLDKFFEQIPDISIFLDQVEEIGTNTNKPQTLLSPVVNTVVEHIKTQKSQTVDSSAAEATWKSTNELLTRQLAESQTEVSRLMSELQSKDTEIFRLQTQVESLQSVLRANPTAELVFELNTKVQELEARLAEKNQTTERKTGERPYESQPPDDLFPGITATADQPNKQEVEPAHHTTLELLPGATPLELTAGSSEVHPERTGAVPPSRSAGPVPDELPYVSDEGIVEGEYVVEPPNPVAEEPLMLDMGSYTQLSQLSGDAGGFIPEPPSDLEARAREKKVERGRVQQINSYRFYEHIEGFQITTPMVIQINSSQTMAIVPQIDQGDSMPTSNVSSFVESIQSRYKREIAIRKQATGKQEPDVDTMQGLLEQIIALEKNNFQGLTLNFTVAILTEQGQLITTRIGTSTETHLVQKKKKMGQRIKELLRISRGNKIDNNPFPVLQLSPGDEIILTSGIHNHEKEIQKIVRENPDLATQTKLIMQKLRDTVKLDSAVVALQFNKPVIESDDTQPMRMPAPQRDRTSNAGKDTASTQIRNFVDNLLNTERLQDTDLDADHLKTFGDIMRFGSSESVLGLLQAIDQKLSTAEVKALFTTQSLNQLAIVLDQLPEIYNEVFKEYKYQNGRERFAQDYPHIAHLLQQVIEAKEGADEWHQRLQENIGMTTETQETEKREQVGRKLDRRNFIVLRGGKPLEEKAA